MEFVSSDTNVWIDFRVISRLSLPFRLPYTYIMYTESITSELLNPVGFQDDLMAAGLAGRVLGRRIPQTVSSGSYCSRNCKGAQNCSFDW